jgi:hypothetical protein
MLQLATKLKAVVQSCSNHQQQTNVQMEALLLQWDNSSAAMEALQQQDKRTKKHVTRLQQQAEVGGASRSGRLNAACCCAGWHARRQLQPRAHVHLCVPPARAPWQWTQELQQRAMSQAALNASALERLQSELSQLGAAQQQLSKRVEAAWSCSSSAGHQVQELSEHLSEMSHVVESVAGCLTAARAQAAAAAPPASSYLSTLLGPAAPPPAALLASLATAAAGAGGASGKHLAAWVSEQWWCFGGGGLAWCARSWRRVFVCPCAQDERLAQVDTWVRRHHHQQQLGRGGCSS